MFSAVANAPTSPSNAAMASCFEIGRGVSIGGAQCKHTYTHHASTVSSGTPKLARMSLAERIRSARIAAGIKEPADLARRVGRRPAAAYQWESGAIKSLKDSTAIALADVLAVNAKWLSTGKGPRTAEGARPVAASENRPGYVRLPLLDVAVSAGTGADVGNEAEVVQYLDVADWWAQQNLGRDLSRIRVLTARGDSMTPEIQPGDVLFVDIGTQSFEAPGVYVLNWQGRALVKRLVPEMRTGRLGLHSSNPAYPAEYVSPSEMDQLRISGRVAAWWTLRRY